MIAIDREKKNSKKKKNNKKTCFAIRLSPGLGCLVFVITGYARQSIPRDGVRLRLTQYSLSNQILPLFTSHMIDVAKVTES